MPNALHGIEAHYDAVLFDFDGVIVESTDIKTAAFRALFADHPDHVDAVEALHRRHEGVNRSIKFEMIFRDILGRRLDVATEADLARRYGELVVDQVVACPAVAGVPEVLEALGRHIPLAVVSSTPDGELAQIVARRDLARCFRVVRGAPPAKAKVIGEIIAAFGWSAGRVAMVGDTPADMEAARANGLRFIGRVASGRASPFPAGTPMIADLDGLADALIRAADPGRAGARGILVP
jgi:phosphoglycolate phosphatase-like HAD superfamily hydrolase